MQELYFARHTAKRQSNIELLRIIAMLLIIAHHFSVHGGFEFSNTAITINRLWIQFIEMGGRIGVNIFILIAGYFLITASAIKMNKVLKLWIQIFTYSVLGFILFGEFGIKELIRSFFPMIIFPQWWFATTYFVLYLISPGLNTILNSLDKKAYQRMLIMMTIYWCLIPTFFSTSFESNNLIWFIYLYALAGYIRIHTIKLEISGIQYMVAALALVFLTFLSVVFFDVIGIKNSFFSNHATYFYGSNKLPVMLISLFLFLGFSKINIKYSRFINLISSATFGVYLIHDNEYISTFFWKTVFRQATYLENSILIPYSIWVIAVVFIICTVIELCRIYIFEKHYMKKVNRVAELIDNYIKRFLNLKFFDRI